MKYLKYGLISLFYGIFFSIGVILVFKYVLPMFYSQGPHSFNEKEIAKIEEELGMSCLDLHKEATDFVINDVGEIINQGIQGKDWVAFITPTQKSYIDSTDGKMTKCRLAQFHAEKLLLDWPDFRDLQKIFGSLKIYSTSYGKGPATSKSLKPSALELLKYDYRNVTSKGSG